MEDLVKSLKSLYGDLLARIDQAKSLFGPLVDRTVKTGEPIFVRESEELGVRQQFRPNHGEQVFLHDHLGRGRFFHSLSVAGGSDHVHTPSTRYEQEKSPHFGFGYSGQLRVRQTPEGEELILVKYVVNGKVPDWLHPNLVDLDDNIRVIEAITLARDGKWLISDENVRRVLNG